MKRLPKEDRAGLYITVIIHLTVIVVLLASSLGKAIQREQSFILDFSRQENLEKLQEELKFKEDINRKLREMLDGTQAGDEDARNITVDRSKLKDAKGIDAASLYREAERVQREMRENRRYAADLENVEMPSSEADPDRSHSEDEYSGASVLSWELEGRLLTHKQIPAYKCRTEGVVTVMIAVNPTGSVVIAEIQEATSSPDRCLRREALEAARASRFNSSPGSPSRQMGEITYQFIAQR